MGKLWWTNGFLNALFLRQTRNSLQAGKTWNVDYLWCLRCSLSWCGSKINARQPTHTHTHTRTRTHTHTLAHCGAMVSGNCVRCHCRRLMSWVAFKRRHAECPNLTAWSRHIRNDEFWKIENRTCQNIPKLPKQPEEKSWFNSSSRYVKTASRFHITGKSEGLHWCQLHSTCWHPLHHGNETVC